MGSKVMDLFCLSPNVENECIEIQMLLADKAQGMEHYRTSGFIGLAPESYNADDLLSLPEQLMNEDD